MRFLVTGGTGFIGSNIVRELLDRGEDVQVLANFATGKKENIFSSRIIRTSSSLVKSKKKSSS